MMRLLPCTAFLLFLPFVVCDLPAQFAWGTATASYQVEGAYDIDGRGMTIWDEFCHKPDPTGQNRTFEGETGDVADNHYYMYPQDISMMRSMNLTHYRMSIAWSRIMPTGDLPLNPMGIAFYNNLINHLMSAGIQPLITLYHWDLPLELDRKGGWLNPDIATSYALYADTCFKLFGDRVKFWLTFNEPLTFTYQGYGTGTNAPARCSNRTICFAGDSNTEPYIAAHNVLRAHADAVDVYRTRYQAQQQGFIGITLDTTWAEPYTQSPEDVAAAQRSLLWQTGWFADPVHFGDYPIEMRMAVGNRLPKFTAEEQQKLRGSTDFYGMNHYTSRYIKDNPNPAPDNGWSTDQHTSASVYSFNGTLIGQQAASSWLYVVPWGMRKVLNWISHRYNAPVIFITENGVDVPNESYMPLQQALNDTFRLQYFEAYLQQVALAMHEDQIDVRGYFAWSFMDNFEWGNGYEMRFGLHYVDYANGLTRYTKQSANWFQWKIAQGPPAIERQ